MRSVTAIILAAAALATAFEPAHPVYDETPTYVDIPETPTPTPCGGQALELECPDLDLSCCDPLQPGDHTPGEPDYSGSFYNCEYTVELGVSACDLKKLCNRTPACCDYSEIGTPINNPERCWDLRGWLKEENKEHLLECKDGCN